MEAAQAPAHPSGLMVELKVASSKRMVGDSKPAAAIKHEHARSDRALRRLDDKIIRPGGKTAQAQDFLPRAESTIIGSIRVASSVRNRIQISGPDMPHDIQSRMTRSGGASGELSYAFLAAIEAFDNVTFGLEIVRERDGERDIALDDRDARLGHVPASMSLDKVHRDVLLRPNVTCCKFRTNRNGPQPSSWRLRGGVALLRLKTNGRPNPVVCS
jgi:hypothetical protein